MTITISITSILEKIHALTALRAYTSLPEGRIPAILGRDRSAALRPIIVDHASMIGVELNIPLKPTDDIDILGYDFGTVSVSSPMQLTHTLERAITARIMAESYMSSDNGVAERFRADAQVALAGLIKLSDETLPNCPIAKNWL